MKSRFLNILLATFLVSATTSCNNLLNITETDFLGGDLALGTVKNNESLLMGAYGALSARSPGLTYGNGAHEMVILSNGVFSDELKVGDFYNAQTTHEWLFSADDVSLRDNYNAFANYYRIIDRANRVLAALPKAVGEGAADEALRTRLQGEALFLRAFSHFELFRFYCKSYDPAGLGLIYMKEPSLENRARDLMGPYFENMVADIETAKGLLADNVNDVYRANKLSAVGLRARVALYMRDWDAAAKNATDYINALPLATQTQFPAIWSDAGKTEIAFKIARTTATPRIGAIYRGLFTKDASGNIVPPTSIPWIPSDKLWDSFDQTNDIRFKEYVLDEPILRNYPGKQSRLVNKYRGTGYATTNENVNDLKVFRTGEMYLIRAEARAELGQVTGANSGESDLNDLRKARITGYANQTISSKETLVTAVLNERFKELAFEGHRFWDLKRRGLAVERLVNDSPATGRTLPANDYHFVLPIPNTEIAGNSLLKQNDGYSSIN